MMEEENRCILEFSNLQQEREAEKLRQAKEIEEKKSLLYAQVSMCISLTGYMY